MCSLDCYSTSPAIRQLWVAQEEEEDEEEQGHHAAGEKRRGCRDSLVVRTSRCGRENPGSNPGYGNVQPFLLNYHTHCIQCSRCALKEKSL